MSWGLTGIQNLAACAYKAVPFCKETLVQASQYISSAVASLVHFGSYYSSSESKPIEAGKVSHVVSSEKVTRTATDILKSRPQAKALAEKIIKAQKKLQGTFAKTTALRQQVSSEVQLLQQAMASKTFSSEQKTRFKLLQTVKIEASKQALAAAQAEHAVATQELRQLTDSGNGA